MTAGDNFFDQPPLRVGTTPLGAATRWLPARPPNTVIWYRARNRNGSARGPPSRRSIRSITVQYGARADEQALRSQLQTVAVFRRGDDDGDHPNANAQIAALNQRMAQNLAMCRGRSRSRTSRPISPARRRRSRRPPIGRPRPRRSPRRCWTSIEGINDDEVATRILALQTALQASYQTTASLYQIACSVSLAGCFVCTDFAGSLATSPKVQGGQLASDTKSTDDK